MPQNWKTRRDTNALRMLVEVASDYGLLPKDVLVKAKLTEDFLNDYESEIEAWQELKAIEQVAQSPDAAAIALGVGLKLHATTLGTTGFAMMASKNLNHALHIAYQFETVSYWFCKVGFETDDDTSTFQLYTYHLPEACQTFCAIRGVASLQVWMNEMLGGDHPALSVKMKCEKPEDDGLFQTSFPCGVEFDAPVNSISFPSDLFQIPLRFADRWTQKRSVEELTKLAAKRQDTLSARITAVVANTPGKILSEEVVAKALYLSASTLRRRLQEQGQTFREIRDTALHSRAKDMLAESNLSVEEIAAQLGYSEAASFIRSFKRIHHVTPASWRRQNSKG